MLSFRDLQKAFRELGLSRESRVLVLADLAALGEVRGGAESVVGALVAQCGLVLTPTFTEQCLITPRVGPENNGLVYGDDIGNAEAEFFNLDLPAQPSVGIIAETLRKLPAAHRSLHPLLSFAAVGEGAEAILPTQTLAEPFAPLAALAEQGGSVLLLGVDHTANIAIHLAEQRAGRKTFTRWALTPEGVVECPGWPGCARGFNAIVPHIAAFNRAARLGHAPITLIPLRDLLNVAEALIRHDSQALLCDHADCARCEAVRASNHKE